MDPKGKVALITGGTRIGKKIAERLAKHGCNIMLTYRSSRPSIEESIRKIQQMGVKASACYADLSSASGADAVIQETDRLFGRLDILINMASVYQKTSFETLDRSALEAALAVDLQSSYLLALKAVPLMRRQGEGRIINFSDWIAASGRPRYKQYAPYYVSKYAVVGLTESLALELAPEILVNAIAPGPILPPANTEVEEEEVRKATPLGRWGGAEEIAKAVLFLIEADFITGECIRVDGGRHLF